MNSRRFTYLLIIVFVVQFSFPLIIQPMVGWRVYLFPPWDYFKYPHSTIEIRDIAIIESDQIYYMRKNLNYFDVHFFDFITMNTPKNQLLEALTKRFFYVARLKRPLKLVEFRCDSLRYYSMGYQGCQIASEEWLE